jgi:hypothetical protein
MIGRAWAIAVVLAGCDEAFDLEHLDPPGADPCGTTLTAPPAITLWGQLLDGSTNAPIAGLTVDSVPGGVAMTDGSGTFAIDVATGTKPLFATLTATGNAAYPPHVIHYQRPFTMSPSDVSSKLLDVNAIEALYPGGRDGGRGTALIALRDCMGDGVAGAKVEIDAATKIVYQGGGAATDGTGVAYALGVAASPIAVHADGAQAFGFTMDAGALALLYLVAP